MAKNKKKSKNKKDKKSKGTKKTATGKSLSTQSKKASKKQGTKKSKSKGKGKTKRQAQKLYSLTVPLETRPGALGQIYEAFAEEGVDVIASWGYQMGPDQAQVHICTKDTDKARDVLTRLGKTPTLDKICLVQSKDRPGEYARILKKIADAGINIESTDALAANGTFTSAFFTGNDQDFARLCEVLEC